MLGISLLISLTAAARSHDQPPRLLLRAAQCLEAKKFLPPSSAIELTFGYFLDENSYPNNKVVYVAKYVTSARSNGLVSPSF